VGLELGGHLLQARDRQAVSHPQPVLVVVSVHAAMGDPATRWLTVVGVAVGSEAALWSHEAKRGERGQPVKPFCRRGSKRENALLWTDSYIKTLCPLFDQRDDPGAGLQFDG
jgi:hypothetical protein